MIFWFHPQKNSSSHLDSNQGYRNQNPMSLPLDYRSFSISNKKNLSYKRIILYFLNQMRILILICVLIAIHIYCIYKSSLLLKSKLSPKITQSDAFKKFIHKLNNSPQEYRDFANVFIQNL